ncbi:MAG TPA: amidase family protein [Chloroflexota bacterium]|nr:amidase family protein [Chloroflexota bacterium]
MAKGPFTLREATIRDIHAAFRDKQLSARELVQLYLNRIERLDRDGPAINSIITVNPRALEEADRLDGVWRASGPVGPLHGIPVILKDQIDAVGMPTTLGSVMFRDLQPDRDAFVVEKLKAAGAIVLAKATLGELGAGDTHGTLFGSTRNPYDLDRTVGGSSGGPAAAMACNFGTLAVGQEGFASIRRPSAWNSIVGMRPTAGLVSRSGLYAGWPSLNGSLGPMTRTVEDLAVLLDVMVGYDAEDPITGLGVGHAPASYTAYLDGNGLAGARIGVLREVIGYESEPEAPDFAVVDAVFGEALADLQRRGATLVDPVTIPKLKESLGKLYLGGRAAEAFEQYVGRSRNPPFRTYQEFMACPDHARVVLQMKRGPRTPNATAEYEYLRARDELTINLHKVMADFGLDAIVHKSVEHLPTLIAEGITPPYVNQKGAPFINTFLVYASSMSVPAGFTSDGLPVGITFLGRPYDDGRLITLAYAYEQATRKRRPPDLLPALPGEP